MIKNLNDFVVYDVEVCWGPNEVPDGWKNPEAMLLASAVVYDYRTKRFHFYYDQQELLDKLNGRIVVGFNSVRFDSKVILGNNRYELKLFDSPFITTWNDEANILFLNYDLLIEIVKGKYQLRNHNEVMAKLEDHSIHTDGIISLDGLSKGTLNEAKSGHGADAPMLFRSGRIKELFEYNLHDVLLTKRLFEFALKNGFLRTKSGEHVNVVRPHIAEKLYRL